MGLPDRPPGELRAVRALSGEKAWYVNFGFWDVKRTRGVHPPGHFNRLIEEK